MKPNFSICDKRQHSEVMDSHEHGIDFKVYCNKAERYSGCARIAHLETNSMKYVLNKYFYVPPECPYILEHVVDEKNAQ